MIGTKLNEYRHVGAFPRNNFELGLEEITDVANKHLQHQAIGVFGSKVRVGQTRVVTAR